MYQMEDGQRKDLADLCCEVLSRVEWAFGAEKVPSVRPRKEVVKSDMAMAKRIYKVQKKGDAKWGQIKMKAVGFPKEKRHGMRNRYNF